MNRQAAAQEEPNFIINGKPANSSQAITIRVAIESFAVDLQEGLGEETHGQDICQAYLRRIDEIRNLMFCPEIIAKHEPNYDVCSICAGTKELLTGEPCGCKTGTIHGELQFLREGWIAEQNKNIREPNYEALELLERWLDFPNSTEGHPDDVISKLESDTENYIEILRMVEDK